MSVKLLVFTITNQKESRNLDLKTLIRLRLAFVPFPISILISLLILFKETQLRYLGFNFSRMTNAKIFFKHVMNGMRSRTGNLHKSVFGMFVFFSKQEEPHLELIDRLNASSIRIERFWVSRSVLTKVSLPTQIGRRSFEFEDTVDILLFEIMCFDFFQRAKSTIIEVKKADISLFPPTVAERRLLQFQTISKSIVGNGEYVFDGKLVVSTSPYFKEELPRDFPSNRPTILKDDSVVFQTYNQIRKIPEALFVGSNRNYYHVMWENIPRLISFTKSSSKPIPPVIPDGLPIQIVELFRIASQTTPVICGYREAIEVGLLLVARDGRYENRIDYRTWREGNIFESRRQDLELLRSFARNIKKSPQSSQRFFVIRSNDENRIPKNYAELERLAKEFQFSVVNPSCLEVHEQISIFEAAEFLIIMTGAAVTNLAFSRNLKGVIFVIGASEENEAARIFWPQYAEFLEINYVCVFTNSDNLLDSDELRTKISSILR